MAQVPIPTFPNKAKLKGVRENSLNPVIQKANALEVNQGTMLRKLDTQETALTSLSDTLTQTDALVKTVVKGLAATFTDAKVNIENKSIDFYHKNTGTHLGSISMSDLMRNTGVILERDIMASSNATQRNPINVLKFVGDGVSATIDPTDSTRALVTIPGGGGIPGGGSINAQINTGEIAPISLLNLTGNAAFSSIQGSTLQIHMPRGRFEGVAKSLTDLENLRDYSEANQSMAFLEVLHTEGGKTEKGFFPYIYLQAPDASTAEWKPVNSVGALQIKEKQSSGQYLVKNFAPSLVKSPNITIVDGNIIIEDQAITAKQMLNGTSTDLGVIQELEFEGDFVKATPIPNSSKKKITITGGKLLQGKIGSANYNLVEKIDIQGNSDGSSIDDRVLKINLPYVQGAVEPSTYENITKTLVQGNKGSSAVSNGQLTVDIPFLKVGKTGDSTFDSTHRSYAFNEPFDKWNDEFQWNPIKEGLEKRWHNDEQWNDGMPWATFDDTAAFDTSVLEFDGNVTVEQNTGGQANKTKVKVNYLLGSKASAPDTEHAIKKIVLPDSCVIDNQVATILVPSGEAHFDIGGSKTTAKEIKDTGDNITIDSDKVAQFVGFSRFPKDVQQISGYDIDSPGKETRVVFVKKKSVADHVMTYSYQEPFDKWKDGLRFNALSAESPSAGLVITGGWIINMYTSGEDKMSQTFYPQDNTTPKFRSGDAATIGSVEWKSLGSVSGKVGDNPLQTITSIEADDLVAEISDDKLKLKPITADSGKGFNKVKAGTNIAASVQDGTLTISASGSVTSSLSVEYHPENDGDPVNKTLTQLVVRQDNFLMHDDGRGGFVGFDRYPKDVANVPGYVLDTPGKETRYAYLSKQSKADHILNQTYGEPFDKWKDSLRWNATDASSPSAEIVTTGGWVNNLYTKNGDKMSQIFYPDDKTKSPMYRVGKSTTIGSSEWISFGSIVGEVGVSADTGFVSGSVNKVNVKFGTIDKGKLSIKQTQFSTLKEGSTGGSTGHLSVLQPEDDSIIMKTAGPDGVVTIAAAGGPIKGSVEGKKAKADEGHNITSIKAPMFSTFDKGEMVIAGTQASIKPESGNPVYTPLSKILVDTSAEAPSATMDESTGKLTLALGKGGGTGGTSTVVPKEVSEANLPTTYPAATYANQIFRITPSSSATLQDAQAFYVSDGDKWNNFGYRYRGTEEELKSKFHLWGYDSGHVIKEMAESFPAYLNTQTPYTSKNGHLQLGYYYCDKNSVENPLRDHTTSSSPEDVVINRIPVREPKENGKDASDPVTYSEMIYGKDTGTVWHRFKPTDDDAELVLEQLTGLTPRHFSIFTVWPDLTVGDISNKAGSAGTNKPFLPLRVVQDNMCNTQVKVDTSAGTNPITVFKKGLYDVTVCFCYSGANLKEDIPTTVEVKLLKDESNEYTGKKKEITLTSKVVEDNSSAYYYPAKIVRFKNVEIDKNGTLLVSTLIQPVTASDYRVVKKLEIDPYKNFVVIEPSSTDYRPGFDVAMTMKNTFGGVSFQYGTESRVQKHASNGTTQVLGARLDPTPEPEVEEKM